MATFGSGLTLIWILTILAQGEMRPLNRTSVFQQYTSRPKLATLLDSIRLQIKISHLLRRVIK